MSDELQYRCAGFVQAEIERYAEEREGERPDGEDGNEESGSESDGEATGGKDKGKKGRAKKADVVVERGSPFPFLLVHLRARV